MIHVLKSYQRDALVALQRFWSRCGEETALPPADAIASAFAATVEGLAPVYLPQPGMSSIPNVCLRIPTGGGKTFVAANACGIARASYLRCDHPVILWLAPSDAIIEQTLRALRSPVESCRHALIAGCEIASGLGTVRVATIEEALGFGPAVYAASAVVIVATIQHFRQTNTEGRKVYARNPALSEHPLAEPSLANVIAHHRPLVIVDEAHNVRTPLSFETLARLSPAAILEITATPSRDPANPSNVLFAASPLDLFHESMIRLPIEVAANPEPTSCLEWALATRNRLEQEAKREADATTPPIRPILLLQAEPTRAGVESIDEVAIERLLTERGIPKEFVAVHTGQRRDLAGVDLLQRDCQIRYIVTKEALREGWDCPWAYVLCTMRRSLTEKDTLQLVGRILRQYRAEKRPSDSLNRAYVAARSANIGVSLQELRGSLIEEFGYERGVADLHVVGSQTTLDVTLPAPVLVAGDVHLDRIRLAALPHDLARKFSLDDGDGRMRILVTTTPDEDRVIGALFSQPREFAAYAEAARRARATSPAMEALTVANAIDARVQRVTVAAEEAGIFEPVDDRHFEPERYRPSAGSHALSFAPKTDRIQRGRVQEPGAGDALRIDVDGGGETVAGTVDGDPTVFLSFFLCLHLRPLCFLSGDRSRWVADLLAHLLRDRGIAIAGLWADRYHLLHTAQAAITSDIELACRAATQVTIFDQLDHAVSTLAQDFSFPLGGLGLGETDSGGFVWKHHLYPDVATMNTNERLCAIHLDNHPALTRWVRNVPRQGFRLPRLPRDGNRWFYPDFVAWLKNGRTAVIEHKGPVEQERDVQDKLHAGEFWAKRTNGIFVMTHDRSDGTFDDSNLSILSK